MSDDATKHAVLLDALEAAGFPRSSLVGAGNAFHLASPNIAGGALDVYEVDGNMAIELTVITLKSLSKDHARRLGAFLLAWGHRP